MAGSALNSTSPGNQRFVAVSLLDKISDCVSGIWSVWSPHGKEGKEVRQVVLGGSQRMSEAPAFFTAPLPSCQGTAEVGPAAGLRTGT